MTFPSSETDTEQTVRSFEALHRTDPDTELVVARSIAKDAAQQSITLFYQLDPDLPIRFFRGVGAMRWEAERLFNGLLAVPKWMRRYDIIHTRSRITTFFAVILGQKVSFETYRQLPLTDPMFFRLLRLLARSHCFLGIVCHSSQSMQALQQGGIPSNKLVVFRNGYEARMFEPRVALENARKALDLPPDRPIVTYAGNVQKAKGVDSLLHLAKMRPHILFAIVGGNQRDLSQIDQLSRSMKLRNLLLTGRQAPDRVALHLQAADLLVIPPTLEPQEKYRRTLLPMKTFLYLGAGKPILAPDTPDLREVLTHHQNAWLVRPDAFDEAASALDLLLGDKSLAAELAKGAADTAAAYSWEKRAASMRDWHIQCARAAA